MGCDEIFLRCYNEKKTSVCEYSRNITDVLNTILSFMNTVRNRKRPTRPVDCIYSDKVYREYSAIINSIRNNDASACFEMVICDEDSFVRLYSRGGQTLKHPDIILLKGSSFTFIVELKSTGKQSVSSFQEQLHETVDYLPSCLRSDCIALIYMPQSLTALPRGYTYDPETYRLQRVLGKRKKDEKFEEKIYAYVYATGLLKYMD